MTVNQIRTLFKANDSNDSDIEMSSIVDINQKVKIAIKMDEDKESYYYSINILDLAKSSITDELIQEMLASGWTLDKKQENIVKMC